MITLYGIPNCDTMKKARSWLDENGIAYKFHDFKKAGLDKDLLLAWIKAVGWETLLNRRGMMWRKLDEETKSNIDEASAVRVMLDNPSIIKRPVLDTSKAIHVGFDTEDYKSIFS